MIDDGYHLRNGDDKECSCCSLSRGETTVFTMIPCFPINSDTDAYHCDIVSNRSSPSHLTKDIPSNIS